MFGREFKIKNHFIFTCLSSESLHFVSYCQRAVICILHSLFIVLCKVCRRLLMPLCWNILRHGTRCEVKRKWKQNKAETQLFVWAVHWTHMWFYWPPEALPSLTRLYVRLLDLASALDKNTQKHPQSDHQNGPAIRHSGLMQFVRGFTTQCRRKAWDQLVASLKLEACPPDWWVTPELTVGGGFVTAGNASDRSRIKWLEKKTQREKRLNLDDWRHANP